MKTEAKSRICYGLEDLDAASMVNTSGGWLWMVVGWAITSAVIYGAFTAGYDAGCGCR